MIYYSNKNVYEAAKERIKYILDEFPDRRIGCTMSGGKDSTTVLHLLKEVWDEQGRTERIPVVFLDQELEAPQTIDYVREVMHLPWVEPHWLQVHFNEWNSSKGEWFHVWGEGEQWAREKEPDSIHEIDLEAREHFGDVMSAAIYAVLGENGICLGGVRIEESPIRRQGLTNGYTYKDITWGRKGIHGMLTFYPIWDWSFSDVWYYIFSNKLNYCKLYNYYMTMRPLKDCRVSSFIHENSIQNLKAIKEIAPQFYAAALRRCPNVNTTVQSYQSLWEYVNGLPPYFKDWDDYFCYLLAHLIEKEENKVSMLKTYNAYTKKWRNHMGWFQDGVNYVSDKLGTGAVHAILAEDTDMTKMVNMEMELGKYYNDNYGRIKAANKDNAQWHRK